MLDTNTVSDLIKNPYPGVRRHAARHPPAALCISAITRSELLFGVARNPLATRINPIVQAFLQHIDTLDWTRAVADTHGELRARLQSRGIGVATLDLMIAAHAMSLDLPLVSSDRVFQQIEGLRLENWME